MLFNSVEFILFFILFIFLWSFFKKKKQSRWVLITAVSLFFYGWWDWRFLFLILFSGLVDYFCGILIYKHSHLKKVFLGISLILNLGILSVFKYASFIYEVIKDIFEWFSIPIINTDFTFEYSIILPLGISFYTFQSISYTVDIYRNRLKPTRNIFHFFSYLVMFPQLVAGPIIRAKDLLKQLKTYKNPTKIEQWHALQMVCFGFFRKVVIADNLAYMIDAAYENKHNYNGTFFWWVIAIGFSFQIYADFSGYSLIARGIAKYMGYHFKMNFNHPYLATGFREFWQRWHISLSTWFRDYVYIPIGGSRKGAFIAVFSLAITMFLSGIWHGANYTFIVWAALHTFFLLFERYVIKPLKITIAKPVSILMTFLLATIAWVYFRAASITEANQIVQKLFAYEPSNLNFAITYFDGIIFLVLAIALEFQFYLFSNFLFLKRIYKKYNLDVVAVIISIIFILFFRGEGKQFIYFQF